MVLSDSEELRRRWGWLFEIGNTHRDETGRVGHGTWGGV